MATTPIIPLHDAVSDNPLNDYRNDITWGTLEMQSPRVEVFYETWSTQDSLKPTDHPLYAFSDWDRIKSWAAGFKTALQNLLGLSSSYTGWIACDHWERFPLSWEWAVYISKANNDRAMVNRVRAAARAIYPELSRMTATAREAAIGRVYNRAVARINSEVIRQPRSLCPSAKIVFYENDRSAFPNATTAAIIQDSNDRVKAWLWPQVNAKSIAIYPFYMTAASPGAGQTTVAASQLYMTTAVTETIRVATANGLDALIWVHGKYHPSNATYGGQIVQDADMAMQLQSAADGGADGALIWDAIESQAELDAFNAWTVGNLEPVVAALEPAA